MSSTPYIKELLDFAIEMAESLSERIPKSESLQRDCKNLAASLRTWRNNLPSEMDFLLRPTGSKSLYHEILVLLSELLCILCQLIWTAHEQGDPPSLATISRTHDAEQKIKSASPPFKKSMDDLGVWQKPRKGYAPLGILFNQTSRSDKGFDITERAMRGYIDVAYNGLVELTTRIGRARKRHVGIRVLAGKTI